jgi:acyl-CoA thioester hydrolase
MNHEIPNWDWTKQGIILAKNEINYLKPVYFSDDCEIEIFCKEIGVSSFNLSYNLITTSKEKNILKSTGESVLVCYDFTTNKTIRIPDKLMVVLKNNFQAL